MADDEFAETLRAMGADDNEIQTIRAVQQPAMDEMPDVQPANMITVTLFFKCQRLWIYAGMTGQRVGLDATHVETRAQHYLEYANLPPHLKAEVWDGLDDMQDAALAVLAEQAETAS